MVSFSLWDLTYPSDFAFETQRAHLVSNYFFIPLSEYSFCKMGSSCSQGMVAEQPLSGIPAVFMFENCGPLFCNILSGWATITRDDSHLNWPLWTAFDFFKLAFLKTKLESHSCKIKQIECYIYFKWYLEASKCIQDSKIN